MKKLIPLLLAALLLFVSCDAPGVLLLEDQLPPLMEKTTDYTVTESIVVTKLDTGESVTFSAPKEMDTFHQRLEGVKCTRDKLKESADYYLEYSVDFVTADGTSTLFVGETGKHFVLDGYHYEALRGGMDMFYLAGLFN